jgi:hypothetical protein
VSWFRPKEDQRLAPRVEVIDVRPGDTLFFQFPNRVPRDVFERLKAQIKTQYGDASPSMKVIVLESGTSVGVIREKEDEA